MIAWLPNSLQVHSAFSVLFTPEIVIIFCVLCEYLLVQFLPRIEAVMLIFALIRFVEAVQAATESIVCKTWNWWR